MNLKTISRLNPQARTEAPRFYASAVHDARIELDDLATMVADRCSLRRADVHGVLVALMDLVPDQLLNGNIVSLGQLGSFYANVSSEGAETEEQLSVSKVRGVNIRYRPTKELKKKLRMIDYKFAG